MKIRVITAQKSAQKGLKTNGAQSLFIQTDNHNFLFGFGTDKTFLKNLQTLGVYSDVVDAAFLPCGSTLHAGVSAFLKDNRRATVYARVNAFAPRYKKSLLGRKNITLDKKLQEVRRILRCKNYVVSQDNSFVLFSLAKETAEEKPKYFTKDENGNLIADDFSHEMHLLVRQDNKRWALFCDRASAGILQAVALAKTLISRNLGGKLCWVIADCPAPSDDSVTYYTDLAAGEVIEL